VGNAEMSQKKPRLKIFENLGSCFRLEGDITFFSVAEFMRVNQLPNDPRLREVVIEELCEMFPDVRIIEEEN
jgi:hypothetical protein